ncbi:glutamine-hydrolyzing GMP synthase [Campylobacter felis]|uniref:GMP synthase [glutamine-hydrolyzing] n=1 Tax=Campylobacter felis TaxID=2974565 RepID=A0ABT7I432_9BACT|nr:glutamine-hydrolyzing GMP synthase [Campylobacter upsaliensis]MDL0103713.1 glutamine-hydrolyzing GMP synthase [Campylobacter felis]MDL0108456.1 glutamine-hydrolyzing GMP synthase [Campylobacter felis]MDL0147072.1 glutamine-hydrolyzing GMP synthase [Campylobacter felis]
MMNSLILVLDFGSQYTQLIARRLREYGVYTEIVPYFEKLDSIKAKNPKGIILSGGPASVYEEGAYKPDSRVFELGIPVLGICYGMQYIAHFFGGSVVRAEAQEFGKAVLEIAESSVDSRLFKGVKQDSIVWMSHADKVESVPSGFVELAKSGNTQNCAIADFKRHIYALQFHPEVVHSECGGEILKNFAVGICGADTSWNMRNFAEAEIAKLREKVLGDYEADSKITESSEINAACNQGMRQDFEAKNGALQGESRELPKAAMTAGEPKQSPFLAQKPTQKVLCAVSGGVDSSVVATLLYRAIGENLIPVFVDTGLLRKGEREAVEAMFRENLKVPLIVADARELFLGRLKGVTDPEKKRKIIGETFIEVFEAEAKKHNTKGEIKFLAQGTLYPDVIESVSVKGPSKTIKSHHNVGGLPEWMKFELIEPLRELFKDEVRALGRELGMPESMLMRHPFPGPGLAIRIMGEVNAADLELLKEADSIFIEELHKWGLYDSVWQAFCVLLNVRSVGVMGDNRTYDNTICVRAVEAMDGMTASFSHLPHAFLEAVSNRIINEVAGINRVVYDITSKPPGTIEWE